MQYYQRKIQNVTCEDDDAMITDYYCPFCGAEYSVTDTPKNQEKNYAYFNMKDEGYVGDLFENDKEI